MGKDLALVLIGGVITLVGGWITALINDRMRAREEARAEKREQTKSESETQQAAARQIETLFSELVDTIQKTPALLAESDMVLIDRKYALVAEIKQKALYLDNVLAGRVRLLTDIAFHAEELAPTRHRSGFHWQGKGTILSNSQEELEKQLSAFVRHRPVPELSAIVEQYAIALEDDLDERRDEFAPESAEADSAQEDWIKVDPENRGKFRISNNG